MLKIHQPYKSLAIIGILFVSGALLVGYSLQISNNSSSSVYAADEDFSTEYRTIKDITYMQDMNRQICSNTETPAANSPVSAYPTATLTDRRDDEEYTIVKLEDGNCWMQQNLRLKGGITLNKDDSDVTGDWDFPVSLTSGTTSASFDSGNHYEEESLYKESTYTTKGVYYSWTAATAGTGDDSITLDGTNVDDSVCPKGWKLPTGGADGQFQNLATQASLVNNSAGSTKARNLPYNFSLDGYVEGTTVNYENGFGRWWSRTVYNLYYSYDLAINAGGVSATNSHGRYSGLSIRCIAVGGLEKNERPLIPPSSKDGNITVNVTPTITLDVSDGVTATAETDKIATGKIEATVTSNSDYNVLLSANEPRLIGKENAKSFISPTSDANQVKPGNDAWGILNASGLYDPITNNPSPFDNTKNPSNNSITHTFNVGISISPSLPADTYSTEVTVTAATK